VPDSICVPPIREQQLPLRSLSNVVAQRTRQRRRREQPSRRATDGRLPNMSEPFASHIRTRYSNMKPKVLIADDHEIVREGIRRLLTRSRPDWQISGEVANSKQAMDAVKRLKPDVVILDITMPGMSGLEAVPHILKLRLRCRILIFTMHDSDWLSTEIRRAGAHGYVQKSQAARDLVAAIECLLQGGTFFRDECKT
jgi:CheY-like chemotaxis protein